MKVRRRNLSVCSSDRATLGGAVSMLRDSEARWSIKEPPLKDFKPLSVGACLDRRSRVTQPRRKISPFCATRTQEVWKKRARTWRLDRIFQSLPALVAGAACAHFERRDPRTRKPATMKIEEVQSTTKKQRVATHTHIKVCGARVRSRAATIAPVVAPDV